MKKIANHTLVLLFGVVMLFVASCSDDLGSNTPDNPVKPVVAPKSNSEVRPADLAALQALGKMNPGVHLFEGDVTTWQGVTPVWKQVNDTLYILTGLTIAPEEGVTAPVHIDLQKANKLADLSSLIVNAKTLSSVSVKAQPKLHTLELNGMGASPLTMYDVPWTPTLKEVSIEGFPAMEEIKFVGGAYDKVTIGDMKKLNLLKFADRNATDSTEAVLFEVKDFVIKGELPEITHLNVNAHQESVDLSKAKLPKLTALALQNGKLSGEFVLSDFPELNQVTLRNNQLTSVKVTNCPKLNDVDFANNPGFTTYSLSSFNDMKTFDVTKTAVASMDFSPCLKLTSLSAPECKLTSLLLPGNGSKLDRFNVKKNSLEVLDLKSSTKVSSVICSENKIKTLDLSTMSDIERFEANNNELTSLIVSDQDSFYSSAEETELTVNYNHLRLSTLDEIKTAFGYLEDLSKESLPNPDDALEEPSFFIYPPQTSKEGVDKTAKTIDLTSHQSSDPHVDGPLPFEVQKKQADGSWAVAPSGEYSKSGEKYTFTGKGVYRIVLQKEVKDVYKFFTAENPYVVGELATNTPSGVTVGVDE